MNDYWIIGFAIWQLSISALLWLVHIYLRDIRDALREIVRMGVPGND